MCWGAVFRNLICENVSFYYLGFGAQYQLAYRKLRCIMVTGIAMALCHGDSRPMLIEIESIALLLLKNSGGARYGFSEYTSHADPTLGVGGRRYGLARVFQRLLGGDLPVCHAARQFTLA